MSPTKPPGASDLEILNEPDWTRTHSHRVGTRGRDARFMGVTHSGDEYHGELEEVDEKIQDLREKVARGELVTVRDIMIDQKDFHLERPEVHPDYWRYVLHTTESFIKYGQPWPINQKRESEQKGKVDEVGKKEPKKEKPKPTPEELALLEFLRHEQQYRSSMQVNDGKGNCPIDDANLSEKIDEADQFSPDNWIPRSDKLIRLTGKHPMNAEPDLTTLFDAGMITPSPIHYVRNHGAVPHLLWENHELEVTADQYAIYSMDRLKQSFERVNIPVFLACDGSRRKELNMIKRTRAFNFTGASASCSYWKGYPDKPIRHGKKFWTWLHWHIDLDVTKLIRAQSILVRAFDSHKNTQPREPVWNIAGMMNNCWYEVKPEIFDNPENEEAYLLFRHPVDAGSGTIGWRKPSTEEQMEEIKRNASSPEQQFTRQEIEKHHTETDCWIVINGNVYDATKVLSWHPGGKGAIMAHAGIVHWDTTEEFNSIHDNYAQDKLKGIPPLQVLSIITGSYDPSRVYVGMLYINSQPFRWVQARLVSKKALSADTRRYTFKLPPQATELGLETGQHVQVGFHFKDSLVVRPYTPVRPILKEEYDGTFDLVVKTYFPNKDQPGGTMSNILDCLRNGEEIEVKGPSGEIRYHGNGCFSVDGKEYNFDNVSLILGGSGVTPGYQVISKILRNGNDKTNIRVIDGNKTENDILLRQDLDEFSQKHEDQFKIVHVLSHPSSDWKGLKGHVNDEIIEKYSFEPGKKNVALLCGPPAMIQKAVLPALKKWGYKEDENLFGF
ncbi:nitrate reductase [Trichophyton equinum CBS 127.97]|uniref:Nitrate reductase [NADPH] n=1 Tax=Trichophyton equinum (strain ATCC MYA-4606 / CBS 127.97) TaxID=559882 RepID=F2PM84_TRIEC|nr:nitrate reductase [Trichophyton equinum CBS 127.97]